MDRWWPWPRAARTGTHWRRRSPADQTGYRMSPDAATRALFLEKVIALTSDHLRLNVGRRSLKRPPELPNLNTRQAMQRAGRRLPRGKESHAASGLSTPGWWPRPGALWGHRSDALRPGRAGSPSPQFAVARGRPRHVVPRSEVWRAWA